MCKNGDLKKCCFSTIGEFVLYKMRHPQEVKELEELCEKLFYTKTKDWEYEKEYRILTTYISKNHNYNSFFCC